MTLSLFVAGDPKGQPRPKAFARKMGDKFVARVYDSGTAEAWKSEIALALRPHLPATPHCGALSVVLHFYFRRPKGHLRTNGQLKPTAPIWHTSKPDADNAAKAVLDACTLLGLWGDDAQIAHLLVTKRYADTGRAPGVAIVVTPTIAPVVIASRPPIPTLTDLPLDQAGDDPPEPDDLEIGAAR